MSNRDKSRKKLDVLSPDFNPEEALSASENEVILPNPRATIYDNLTWFVETENGIFPRKRTSKKSQARVSTATTCDTGANTSASTSKPCVSGSASVTKTSKTNTDTSVTITSKAMKTPCLSAAVSNVPLSRDSENIKGSASNVNQNVLTKMDTAVGPLAFLKKCMDEKLRAKVYIRGAAEVRGFCVGFVEAFDKHMNLVLKDVYETWKRPRKAHRKNISIEAADEEKREKARDSEESAALKWNTDSTSLHKHAGNSLKGNQSNENACYSIARWVVKRRTKKKDVCERHIDQLLIRGEQVVCVMLER